MPSPFVPSEGHSSAKCLEELFLGIVGGGFVLVTAGNCSLVALLTSGRDQRGLTRFACDGFRAYKTDVERIVLFLGNLRFERRPFVGDQDVFLPRTIGNRD